MGLISSSRRLPWLSWSDRSGSHKTLLGKRMVVGASAAADLVIDDVTVSRMHAELEARDHGTWVHDLASRNGTTVNDTPIRETVIRDGGLIRIGTTTIRVDYTDAVAVPVELWATDEFHGMVGRSRTMHELFALLARVAPTDASILIHGETGTGKELVARSIHDASLRQAGPFVVVDCAALPENLLDVELFGHTKGAFTGALQPRAGAIESADGGTVFLDEIGELPITMQPKLLRVLEQRTVRRIGESTHRPVDVRFVSATHRDLLSMVSRGEFREDLYFRLCVLPVEVPPLRERKEDIEVLVQRFLKGEDLSPSFVASLAQHAWRGNVRELRNFVERARALGETSARKHEIISTHNRFSDEEMPTSSPRSHRTMPPPAAGLPSLAEPLDDAEGTSPFALPALPPPSTRMPVFAPIAPEPPPPPMETRELVYEGDYKTFRERWIDEGERRYLRQMMERHHKNVTAIAREAGVARTYIYRLMRKHGL